MRLAEGGQLGAGEDRKGRSTTYRIESRRHGGLTGKTVKEGPEKERITENSKIDNSGRGEREAGEEERGGGWMDGLGESQEFCFSPFPSLANHGTRWLLQTGRCVLP